MVDLALVAGIPALLLGIAMLPLATRRAFVFAYAEPTVVTAYAAHFVHLTGEHLLVNLSVYLLVIPLAYGLARRSRRLDLFRVAFVTYVFAFPFVLSGLNLLIARPRIGYGFSGVTMAFLGLLTLLLNAAVTGDGETTIPGTARHAPGLFFIGTGVVAALAVPSSPLRLFLVVVSVVAALGYVGVPKGVGSARSSIGRVLDRGSDPLILSGLVVFLLVPVAAFPATPSTGGTVVNLYTHLLGYCLGFIAPYMTLTITDGWWSKTVHTRDRASMDTNANESD